MCVCVKLFVKKNKEFKSDLMTSFNTALSMRVFADISKALPKRRICEVFDSFPVVWRSESNLTT